MSVPMVVVMAILPKCPACLVAYGSLFAASGVSAFVTGPLAKLLAVGSLLFFIAFAIVRRSPVFGLAGALAVVSIHWVGRDLGFRWGTWLGLALMLAGCTYMVVRRVAADRATTLRG
jgi:hypothetical protein